MIKQLVGSDNERNNTADSTSPLKISLTGVVSLFAMISFFKFLIIRDIGNVALSLFTIILACSPALIEEHLSWHISLPAYLLILLYAPGPLLGHAYNFYHIIPWWDKLLHTAAGFIFALIGLYLGKLLTKGLGTRSMYVIFALCFSISVACVWEFFEFSCDQLLGTDMQQDRIITEINSYLLGNELGTTGSIKEITDVTINGFSMNGYIDVGLIDTMGDMIVETLGALLFTVVYIIDKGRHLVVTPDPIFGFMKEYLN